MTSPVRRFARTSLVVTALVVAVTLAQARPAFARPAGGDFGLGLILGGPTGLSGALYLGDANMLDFAVGIDAFHDNDFYAHVTYLWILADLASGGSVGIPLYAGIGGLLLDHNDQGFGDDLHLGPRGAFGVSFDFQSAPFQIFLELGLGLIFHFDHDHGNDDSFLYLDGALGFRFFF